MSRGIMQSYKINLQVKFCSCFSKYKIQDGSKQETLHNSQCPSLKWWLKSKFQEHLKFDSCWIKMLEQAVT